MKTIKKMLILLDYGLQPVGGVTTDLVRQKMVG
jgi:hypothetical protein